MIEISLSPQQNGNDDWPRLKALADLYAYKAAIALRPGLWVCRSKQRLPSGTTIIGSAGVRIKQELAHTGTDPFNAAFAAGPSFEAAPATARIEGDPGCFDSQVTISANVFSEGQIVRIWRGGTGLLQHYFTITKVDGQGPVKITLDRSLGAQFKSNDLVEGVKSIPQDINILGNGMKISGTGDRYVEFAAAKHCEVIDLHADNEHGHLADDSPAMSFDIGGLRSSFHRCSVVSPQAKINDGIIIESGYNCMIYFCSAQDIEVAGLGLYASYGSRISQGKASNCEYGAYVGGGEGCRNCDVIGGSYENNRYGVHFGASYDTQVSNVRCDNNQVGIFCSTNEQRSATTGCTCNGNKIAPIVIQPGCSVNVNSLRAFA
jgi:hypothetical protein